MGASAVRTAEACVELETAMLAEEARVDLQNANQRDATIIDRAQGLPCGCCCTAPAPSIDLRREGSYGGGMLAIPLLLGGGGRGAP